MAEEFKRKKRKKFNPIPILSALLIMVVTLLAVLAAKFFTNDNFSSSKPQQLQSELQSQSQVSSKPSVESEQQTVSSDNNELNASYSNLLLVNGEKPLSDDYDYESELVTIPDEYKNGQLNQINKNVWPFMKAMLEAAWEDGVDLKVWSPYRSYETQNMLYQNQVKRELAKGLTGQAAEDKAATVVARPGTSEHNTGLAADFNMASDNFETTEMYTWMKENAADYGFIMRYSAEKQSKTGVIHESWHWRFVGINEAKEINRLGMCLEEYVEYKNKG